jgi:hypothetical protein
MGCSHMRHVPAQRRLTRNEDGEKPRCLKMLPNSFNERVTALTSLVQFLPSVHSGDTYHQRGARCIEILAYCSWGGSLCG